jgi:hypothetical protein
MEHIPGGVGIWADKAYPKDIAKKRKCRYDFAQKATKRETFPRTKG